MPDQGGCWTLTKGVAVISYFPKWINQETGDVQARSLSGYFSSIEAAVDLAANMKGRKGWEKRLEPEEIPQYKTIEDIQDIPRGEEQLRGVDSKKIVSGYLVVSLDVFASNTPGTENEGVRFASKRIRFQDRLPR